MSTIECMFKYGACSPTPMADMKTPPQQALLLNARTFSSTALAQNDWNRHSIGSENDFLSLTCPSLFSPLLLGFYGKFYRNIIISCRQM